MGCKMKKTKMVVLELCGEKRFAVRVPDSCPDIKIDELLPAMEKLYDRDMGSFEKITPPVSVASQRSSATTFGVSTRALEGLGRTLPAMEFARALEKNQILLGNSFGPMLEIMEKRHRQLRHFAETSAGLQKMPMLALEAVSNTLAQSEPFLNSVNESRRQMASFVEIRHNLKDHFENTRKLVEAIVRRIPRPPAI